MVVAVHILLLSGKVTYNVVVSYSGWRRSAMTALGTETGSGCLIWERTAFLTSEAGLPPRRCRPALPVHLRG